MNEIIESTVHSFHVNLDTEIATLPDTPCNQIDFIIYQNHADSIYIGRVEDGYEVGDWLPAGIYSFVVANANEIWYVGNKQIPGEVLKVRYWTKEENNE